MKQIVCHFTFISGDANTGRDGTACNMPECKGREQMKDDALTEQRYENDELPESLEFAEWIGEYRLLSRLREKADAYRGIKFVH